LRTVERRGPRALAVALLGFALAVLLAVATAKAADPEPTQITSGSLSWGFKGSFRGYIGGTQGTTAGGGATLDANAVATLPVSQGTFDPTGNATDISFAGFVQYRSHCEAGLGLPEGECALDLTFKEFHVVIDRDEQTLYAHVVGRKLQPGYPMTDFGTIAVANLGIEPATVASAGGTTAWSGITETTTAAAVDATTYPAGTPLDLLSFSYQGPGGKPDLGENWTPPGTVGLRASHTWTGAVTQNQPAAVYVDDAHGVVDVLNSTTSFDGQMPALSALSTGGLEPRGDSGDFLASEAEAAVSAFDPATGTVFLGRGGEVVAATWNPSTSGYDLATLGGGGVAALAWDAAEDCLYGIVLDYEAGSAALARWQLDGADWDRTENPLPASADGWETPSYYTPGSSTNQGFAALSDGSLILTRGLVNDPSFESFDFNPAPLRLVPGEDDVAVSELTGAITEHQEGAEGEAEWVAAGPGGNFVIGPRGGSLAGSFVRFGHLDGGGVTLAAQRSPVPTPAAEPLVAAFDPDDGTVWLKGVTSGTIVGLDADGSVLGQVTAQGTARAYTVGVGADHDIYTGGRNQEVHAEVTEVTRLGVSPTVTTQPQAQTTSLGSGQTSGQVTFTAAAEGAPAPTIRWQRRAPGATTFVDLAGASSPSVTVDAGSADNGAAYRAVFANSSGEAPTDPATLRVDYAPQVTLQPADQTVAEGGDAAFVVLASGSPDPTVTWQRQVGGAWQDIASGQPGFRVEGGTLTVVGAARAASGSLFRATIANSAGTVVSDVAKLQVAGGTTIPPGGIDVTMASLDWLGNEEVQSAPPFGGSNYMSAGLSGGTEATYRASDGNAAVYEVSATGTETLATWATRAAHVSNGGRQLARLSAGRGHINADGTGSVAWKGSFSVNFYGGLVPFTIADPEIYFGGDGTGYLSATLEGCSSSMVNPNECTALEPRREAIIATFQGVTLDPFGKMTIQPDYAGVEVEVGEGGTPQNREVAGWGAWPGEFVGFQLQTGLSSYWYSSGGAADAKKPPLPLTVDFGGTPTPETEPEAPGGGGAETPGEVTKPEESKPDAGGSDGSSAKSEGSPSQPPAAAPSPAPPAKPARVWQSRGARKLDAGGTAQLAAIACPAGTVACRLVVPERTAARIGGKRYLLTVLAPERIKAGGGAKVRIRLPKAARSALGTKKLTVRVPIVVDHAGRTSKQIAKVTIAGRG
jgi:hypothetical protein